MQSATLFTLLSLAAGSLGALAPRYSDSQVCFLCAMIGTTIPSAPAYVENNELVCPYADDGTGAPYNCVYDLADSGALDDGKSFTWCSEYAPMPDAQPSHYVCPESVDGLPLASASFTSLLTCLYGVGVDLDTATTYCFYNQDTGVKDPSSIGGCPTLPVPCSASPQRRNYRRTNSNLSAVPRRKFAAPRAAALPRPGSLGMDARAAFKKRTAH